MPLRSAQGDSEAGTAYPAPAVCPTETAASVKVGTNVVLVAGRGNP